MPAPFLRESRIPRFCRRYPESIVFFNCKTLGFFLKMSKKIGKAWRKVLFYNTASVPNLWWIPRPGSSQISYSVNFSRIPRCILAKSRITRIAFQTLIIVWDNSFVKQLKVLCGTFLTLFLEQKEAFHTYNYAFQHGNNTYVFRNLPSPNICLCSLACGQKP